MSGLNLIRAYNDLTVATGAPWPLTPLDVCARARARVITRAGCTVEQNGCIIGNVHDTALSVGVCFFPFLLLLPRRRLLPLLSLLRVGQTLITGDSAGS